MLRGEPVGTAVLQPKKVGTLTKMLLEGAVPMFFGPPMLVAVMLPNKIGALAKNLFETLPGSREHMPIIPIRQERATPIDMHPNGRGVTVAIGQHFRVLRNLQSFGFEIIFGIFDGDGIRA
jgi:hypothetical protein